ncbi:MAG: YncE family protein [Clostridium sp.]
MKYLILTNTASDNITILNPYTLKTQKINLKLNENDVGPCGIDKYDGRIVVANNYDNSISIVNLEAGKLIEETHYIGAYSNDVKVFEDYFLVTCGESNSLIGFNKKNAKIDFEVLLGEFPYSITINRGKKIAYVTNMQQDNISVVNIEEKKKIGTIETKKLPTKILYSYKNDVIFVCESYLGENDNGNVIAVSTKDNNILGRVMVGKGPLDMCEKGRYLYVSNFEDGTISVIDIKGFKEVKRIYLGGMPKGIQVYKENIFVADYYNNSVMVVNMQEAIVKAISVSKEPNAMILMDLS